MANDEYGRSRKLLALYTLTNSPALKMMQGRADQRNPREIESANQVSHSGIGRSIVMK
jgi:hypothetical protein